MANAVISGFFERKYQEWREEQLKTQRDLQKHEHANAVYIAEGIQLLRIAREAAELYVEAEL